MNNSSFLDNFQIVAKAPGGIRRLRELVLTLAIRGDLIQSQRVQKDGRALLESILLQREQLVSNGELNYTSESSISPQSQLPFTVPKTWTTATLGQVCSIIRGVTFPASAMQRIQKEGVVACLKTSNVQEEIDWDNLVFIAPEFVKREDQWLRVGDIVMSMANSRELVGKVAIARSVPLQAAIGGFLGILRPILALPEYLFIVLRSSYIQDLLREGASQTTNIANVSLAKLRPAAIPLPPLEVQKRIVAKVDELMRLCDRLEAQQQEREKLLPLLSHANHIRFAAEPTSANLKAIFHEPGSSITEDLRKSILTHAIEGRFTKDRSSSNGQSTSFTFETPFALPKDWRWETLGDLVEFIGGSQPAKSQFRYAPQDGYTRLVQIRDFKSDEYQTYVPTPLAKRPFNEDDVMIGRYGPPVFQILRGLSGTYNVALMKAQPRNANIEKTFLYYLLQERRIHDKVVAESDRTAGQSGVRKPLLNAFVIGLPPIPEQRRIVATIERLFSMIDELESRQRERHFMARDFSQAAIAAVTFREFPKDEQMKSPKTEVETVLRLTATRTEYSDAPLATLLSKQKAEGTAKVLWQLSGMRIDAFYRQLKTEMANGWIEEDRTKRSIKEVEVG